MTSKLRKKKKRTKKSKKKDSLGEESKSSSSSNKFRSLPRSFRPKPNSRLDKSSKRHSKTIEKESILNLFDQEGNNPSSRPSAQNLFPNRSGASPKRHKNGAVDWSNRKKMKNRVRAASTSAELDDDDELLALEAEKIRIEQLQLERKRKLEVLKEKKEREKASKLHKIEQQNIHLRASIKELTGERDGLLETVMKLSQDIVGIKDGQHDNATTVGDLREENESLRAEVATWKRKAAQHEEQLRKANARVAELLGQLEKARAAGGNVSSADILTPMRSEIAKPFVKSNGRPVVPSRSTQPAVPSRGSKSHITRRNFPAAPKTAGSLPSSAPPMSKRERVAREILHSERVYVQGLCVVIASFKKPLSTSRSDIITPEDAKALFGQIEVIMAYNSLLLRKLEQRMDKWTTQNTVLGDIFSEIADYLKIYRGYINNYPKALESLEKCRKNKKFSDFLMQVAQEVNKEGGPFRGYDIEDFLITPIQRIPRYRMLLESLFQTTTEEHKDFELLKVAIEKIKAIAKGNEDAQKEAERVSTIVQIQNKFPHEGSGSVALVQPRRKLVLQGKVKVCVTSRQASTDKKFKEQTVFLFNNLLLVAKKKNKILSHVSLESMATMDLFVTELNPSNEFEFSLADTKSRVYFSFLKEDERKEWQDGLEKYITKSQATILPQKFVG